jgi:hypothetical protein
MYQQESIYNLVPKGKIIPGKGASYHSRYPANTFPTASTFIPSNSSFPGTVNCNGDISLPRGAHPLVRKSGTFGLPEGSYSPDPKNFHKKGDTKKIYPPCEPLRSKNEIKKPNIPALTDVPIYGLKTEKNFIISNAVDNILMQPRKKNYSVEKPFHKYYGKVPDYIKKYKLNHENELKDLREIKRRHQEEEDAKQRLLTEAEVKQLREGLKKRWEFFNNRYTGLTHKKYYDNLVLLRNKEGLEKELGQIENDLKKLNCKNVVIDMTK